MQALLERTGYTLDVTTGQRKYGGPPPDEVFKGTQPGIGTEVRDIFVALQVGLCCSLTNPPLSSGVCWENP